MNAATYFRMRPALVLGTLVALLVAVAPGATGAPGGKAHTITFVTPSGGATLSGEVAWLVSVSGGPVNRVEFLVDGASRWTETFSPYEFNGDGGTLDTRPLARGLHTLEAVALDRKGGVTASGSITVNVDNEAAPPTSTSPPTPVSPAVVAPPTVTGDPVVGASLAGSLGSWTGTDPLSYSRAWERCKTGSCTPVSGATGPAYALTSADVGFSIRQTVTASNAAGSVSTASAQTAAVTSPPSASTSSATLGASLPARMPESTGTSFYVDGTRGSDSNPGTLASPWKTINKALASVPASGSIINVRAGTYVGQHQLVGRSGNPSNPMTLQAFPGEQVLLTTPPSSTADAVWIARSGGFRLRGFEVTSPTGNNGIRIENSNDVEVVDCTIHDTGHMGLQVSGNGTTAPTGSRNVQVWNNRFYDNGGAWIFQDPYWARGDHSIYWGAVPSNTDGIDHSAYGGIIANNLFHDQPYGRQVQVGAQSSGLIITNNTFYRAFQSDDRAGNAIQIYGEGNAYDTRSTLVVNNIISFAAHRGVYGSGGSSVMATNVVRNNLAYGNPDGDFLNWYGSTSNVLFTLGTNVTGQNPLFVNAAAGDLRLQSGSPAIGRADPAYAPPTDHTGKARSGAPDLGALEH